MASLNNFLAVSQACSGAVEEENKNVAVIAVPGDNLAASFCNQLPRPMSSFVALVVERASIVLMQGMRVQVHRSFRKSQELRVLVGA